MLYVIDTPSETVLLDMRVVLGKKGHETPAFNGVYMTHIITNPTWTAPKSITEKELIPEIRKNGWYGKGWTILDHSGNVIDPSNVIFKSPFPYVIRQEPGHTNALGYVKFRLEGAGSIFMHDTQARELFRRENRFFSHGCIRLEKPIELANLFGVDVDLNGKVEKWHKIDPVPVYITEGGF